MPQVININSFIHSLWPFFYTNTDNDESMFQKHRVFLSQDHFSAYKTLQNWCFCRLLF